MDEYSDKRILVDQTRQPRENEFIFHDRIVFGGEQLQEIFEYIMVNSNVRITWMAKDNFVNKEMSGIRITFDGWLERQTIGAL